MRHRTSHRVSRVEGLERFETMSEKQTFHVSFFKKGSEGVLVCGNHGVPWSPVKFQMCRCIETPKEEFVLEKYWCKWFTLWGSYFTSTSNGLRTWGILLPGGRTVSQCPSPKSLIPAKSPILFSARLASSREMGCKRCNLDLSGFCWFQRIALILASHVVASAFCFSCFFCLLIHDVLSLIVVQVIGSTTDDWKLSKKC